MCHRLLNVCVRCPLVVKTVMCNSVYFVIEFLEFQYFPFVSLTVDFLSHCEFHGAVKHWNVPHVLFARFGLFSEPLTLKKPNINDISVFAFLCNFFSSFFFKLMMLLLIMENNFILWCESLLYSIFNCTGWLICASSDWAPETKSSFDIKAWLSYDLTSCLIRQTTTW